MPCSLLTLVNARLLCRSNVLVQPAFRIFCGGFYDCERNSMYLSISSTHVQ